MKNTYGHFANEGKEFVITNPKTPRHWYNYLWNDSYIAFTSQVGFGEGFSQDQLGRRVPVVSNRNIYILEIDSNEYWTANALPIQKEYSDYRCIHGLGYSKIMLQYKYIASSFLIFVPDHANCEIWSVKITNNRPEPAKLKIIPYFRTELDGVYKPQGYNTDIGYYDPSLKAVIGRSFRCFGSGDSSEVYGYLMGSKLVTGYDSRKNAFIGVYGEELYPEALLERRGCTDSECIAEKLCFALETTIELKQGEELELDFVVGMVQTIDELKGIRERFLSENGVFAAFESMAEKFVSDIDGIIIDTPDTNLNYLFNNWLKHQANMGSRWARVRHNGYRDLTSDCECLGTINPDLAWERLKRVLSYQYSNGYAPRTVIDGSIKDNNFSDNTVWLTFAVYSLLKERGRVDMLDEIVDFNDGSNASVYEHIKRSVDFLWDFKGLHGLIKIWGGDWNDCMNRVGLKGKGVSVWLSIAWYRANRQFAEIAGLKGNLKDQKLSLLRGNEMKDIIDRFGWDGEYYLDAYTDESMKIGSKENEDGKLFLIPQLWAVLSGVSKDGREIKAMEAVDKYLETELGTLVSWPAYKHYDPAIGTMTQKPAGVHENGGVYLHTSAWKLAVDAIMKRNDKVQLGIEKILPANHKWEEKKCEPYILCNSYFTRDTGYRYGTPGQSWRTAAGPWLAKSFINYVFGLQPEMDGLRLCPCLPPDWRTCSIQKQFRTAIYRITYIQLKQGGCNNIEKILINNKEHTSDILPFHEKEQYDVQVLLT